MSGYWNMTLRIGLGESFGDGPINDRHLKTGHQ